ncbi:MAG: ATPase, T2SS/T4P/T4SS family, partial [Patescibacteria group bacterium]
KTGLAVALHITPPDAIRDIWKLYHKGLSAALEAIEKNEGENGNHEEKPEELKNLAQDLPIVKIVDTMLEYAILEKASDIHIEPAEKEVSVRYRVDGVLRNVMTLPKATHAGVTARIKILSNLKLDE